MIKKLSMLAALAFVAVSPMATVYANHQPNHNPGGNPNIVVEPKVTICHRSNSVKNPYTEEPVAQSSVDGGNDNGDHYSEHQGPLASSEQAAQLLKDNKTDWGDIIPPVAGKHAGLNWSAQGQAMYANGCAYVAPGGQGTPGGQGGGQPQEPQQPAVPGVAVTPQATAGGAGAASPAAPGTPAPENAVVPVGAVDAGNGITASEAPMASAAGIGVSLALVAYALMRSRGLFN